MLGIDLGTAFARVGIVHGGTPFIVPTQSGETSIPAAVAFEGKKIHVGKPALRQAALHPSSAVLGSKRIVGLARDDRLVEHLSRVGALRLAASEALVLDAGGKAITPDKVVTALMGFLRLHGESLLPDKSACVVLTTPAWHAPEQRAAITVAANAAWLPVQHVLTDLSAAAVCISSRDTEPRTFAIADAGAGGTSIAVFHSEPGSLLLVGGAAQGFVGGDDVDRAMAGAVLQSLVRARIHVPDNEATLELLRRSCELMKHDLSRQPHSTRPIPLPPGPDGRPPVYTMTWHEFAPVLQPYLGCMDACARVAVERAGPATSEVSSLYMLGGMSCLQPVRERVERVFGRQAIFAAELSDGIALGAARYAAGLTSEMAYVSIEEVECARDVEPTPVTLPPPPPPMPRPTTSPVPMPPPTPAPVPTPPAPVPTPPPTPVARPVSSIQVAISAKEEIDYDEVRRGGKYINPTTPGGLMKLPLAGTIAFGDTNPITLPSLLLYFFGEKDVTGTLKLATGASALNMPISQGRAYVDEDEQLALYRLFETYSGTYEFEPGTPDTSGLRWTGFERLVMRGLRAVGRRFDIADLERALAENLTKAPIPREDAKRRILALGLTEEEHALIKQHFKGQTGAQRIAANAADQAKTVLVLLVVLSAFGCIEWRDGSDLKLLVGAKRLIKMSQKFQTATHFEVLDVHWSAPPEEIRQAHKKIVASLKRGGEWDSLEPTACELMRKRVSEAWAIVADDRERALYIRSTYKDVDFDGVHDVFEGSIDSHEFRGATRQADEVRGRLRRLDTSFKDKPKK